MENIDESLKCPICLDYAEDPYECINCSILCCYSCIHKDNTIILKQCPICRAESNFKQSQFAKRIIGNLSATCPNNCEAILTKADLKSHIQSCPKRLLSCNKCEYKGMIQEFKDHIISSHMDYMVNTLSSNVSDMQIQTKTFDYFTNSNGDKLYLGSNDIYYCGKRLGFICGCCDGNCGPSNGCCCNSCMKFNCKLKMWQKVH